MRKVFKRFVGVDLGGGKGKKTSVAILEAEKRGVVVTALLPRPKEAPLYDDALVALLLGKVDGSLVCMDAPLSLPPCLTCRVPVCPGQAACVDPEVELMRKLLVMGEPKSRDCRRGKPHLTPYTQRATDVYLQQVAGIIPRETLGQAMGPLTSRAIHLRRCLAEAYQLEDNLIEVLPRATLNGLGQRQPYKKNVDRRLDILESLTDLSFAPGVWREACRQSDHLFDAVICAYTGYLRQRDDWPVDERVILQGNAQGWIWFPPNTDPPAA
jgi:hypothetical protein